MDTGATVRSRLAWRRGALALLLALSGFGSAQDAFERDRIQPYAENPHVWQYRGEPILLVGGTHDDNPFNNPSHDPVGGTERLSDHLDLFASAGGNYVRNTMSHRDILNVYPYLREPDLFVDAMEDPEAWTAESADHGLHVDESLARGGALAVWSDGPGDGALVLGRSIPATDFTHGTIELWLWVRDDATADRIEEVRVRLASRAGTAARSWEGEITSGWHVLIFHIDDFDAGPFDPAAVTGIRLEAQPARSAEVGEGDLLWDDLAVRGRFDLDRFNPEYFERLERFLDAALERDIIVQIELWDKVDLFDDGGPSARKWDPRRGWSNHPFNPRNNVNYTAATSGLREVVDWSYHPRGDPPLGDMDTETVHPFFYTPPTVTELLSNGARELRGLGLAAAQHETLTDVVLPYQEAFVARILEVSLEYPNVLYTINNETFLPTSDWSDHWARFVHARAEERGREVEVGDMRGERRFGEDPAHGHAHILRNPDLYTFIDVSQNNTTKSGDAQWDALQWVRAAMDEVPGGVRPMNNVKIYDFRPSDTDVSALDFAIQKYWRNIVGGAASARFHRRMGAALHRPLDGDGSRITDESNEPGLANLKSASMLAEAADIHRARPDNAILEHREANEAYAARVGTSQYVVYFPAGGAVSLRVPSGAYEVRWLDVMAARWHEASHVEAAASIELSAPLEPHAVVVVTRRESASTTRTAEPVPRLDSGSRNGSARSATVEPI